MAPRSKPETLSERTFDFVMTEYRSLVVVVFALPLSFVWDILMWARAMLVSYLHSAPSQHAERVRSVSEQVKARPAGQRLCTNRPGWQSISLSYRTYKKDMHAVDLPGMMDIISIDLEARTVTVEPGVSTGQLTHMLLPMGYTLPVVPEMDDLTMGGLICGTGIESSSHRCGLFHEQCVSFELCLADGKVVNASATELPDLFQAVPWSYGTLGLLLSATIRIVPCQPLVKLTYYPFHDKEKALAHFAKLSSAGDAAPEFVETLAFSNDHYVVMSGEPAAAPGADGPLNVISRWHKPWFFKHVESKLWKAKGQSSSAETVEYIPLRDYYHRHTRSMFWEMEMMFPLGNHAIMRWTLGWLLPPKVSFLKLTQTEFTRKLTEETHVAQDFLVPMRDLGSILSTCHTAYDRIYPVWLCPHSHRALPGSILVDPVKPEPSGEEMWVDVGVYGLPVAVKEKREFDMVKAMRCVEGKLRETGSVQMLYADIFQTREEFEQMFPHEGYRKVRAKYHAEGAFPEPYDKMHVLGVKKEKRK